MRKFSIILVASIFLNMLQSAIFTRIQILHVTSDIVIAFVVCYSLVRNNYESMVAAVIAGIIRDSFFPEVFGMNSLLFLGIAYLIGILQKRIYKDSIIIAPLFTLVGTVIKGLIYYFFFYTMDYKFDFSSYFSNIILVEALLNSIISIFIYKLILRVNSIEAFKNDWRF